MDNETDVDKKAPGLRLPSKINRPARAPNTPPAVLSSINCKEPIYKNSNRRMSDNLRRESDASIVLTEDTDSFIIGNRVWVGGTKPGSIAYIGETQFAPGDWAGVVLDEPIGKNDGSVAGSRYFQCASRHGIFSRLTRLTRYPLQEAGIHISPDPKISVNLKSVSPSLNTSSTSLSSSISHYHDLKIGDRVIVSSSQGSKTGILRYLGMTEFAPGDWCGVELDVPAGKNDGSVADIRYFECPPKHGLFALVQKVSKSPSSKRSSLSVIHKPTGAALNTSIRKTSSRESLISLSSINSTTSSNVRGNTTTRRVRQSTPVQSSLQEMLKEKQQEIDMLRKERNLERERITKSAIQADNAEQSVISLKHEYNKYREDTGKIILDAQSALAKLLKEKEVLNVQLEDEKKKCEDLLFRFEEESLNNEDIQKQNVDNIVHENKIQELEEQLNEERKRIAQLEYDNKKLSEIEKESAALRSANTKYIELENQNFSLSETKIELEKLVQELNKKIVEIENKFRYENLNIQNTATLDLENLQKALDEKSLLLIKTLVENQNLCTSMNIEINELKETITNLKNKHEKQEELTVANFKEIIDEKDRDIESKINEIDLITVNLKTFQEKIEAKDKNIEEISETLQNKTDEIEKHINKILIEEERSLGLKKTQELLQQTVEDLQNQLKIQNVENLNIQNELKIVKNRMAEEKKSIVSEKENSNEFVEKILTENKNFETKVSELENIIKSKDVEKYGLVKSFELNLENQLQKNAELSTEITDSSMKLKIAHEEIQNLETKITELKNAVTLAEETKIELKSELEMYDNNIKKLNKNLEFSNEKINQLNADKTQLEARISSIINSSASSSEQLIKYNEELTSKNKDITELRQKISQLEIISKDADQKLHEKDVEIKSSNNQIDIFKSEIVLQKDNYQKLTNNLNTVQDKLAEITSESEVTTKSYQNQISQFEIEMKSFQDKLFCLNDAKNTLEIEKLSLQHLNDNYLSKVDDLSQVNINLEKEIEKLKNEFEERIAQSVTLMTKVENELETYKDKYKISQNEIEILKKKFTSLEVEISNSEFKLKDSTNKIESFEEKERAYQMSDSEKTILIQQLTEKFEKQLNIEEQLVKKQKNTIKTLNKELEEQKNKNAEIINEKSQYKNEINSVITQNNELTAIKTELEVLLKKSDNKVQEYTDKIKNLELQINKLINDQCQLEKENSKINLTLQEKLNESTKKTENQNNNDQFKSSNIISESSNEKVIEDNETYKGQIDFLNSVIVEMQKKNETLLCRIEVLEMGVPAAEAADYSKSTIIKKSSAPRMFCDICDQFDLHETEDCHMQSQDSENIKSINMQTPKLSAVRPYCENCEMFGHDTSNCDDAETF